MTSNRPAYRFANNAVTNISNEFGNYILKRGAGEIRKPAWSKTDNVIRILPQWNFDENRWEPYRRSQDPMDFGDFIRRYEAVRGFGENGITLLLFDPQENPTYDINSNPCVLLYKAINNSIDNKTCDPSWPSLLRGGANKRAPLSRPVPIYITRCGIFRIKGKDMATAERAPLGLAENDPAYFFELPKTAGEKLVAMLEERNDDYTGDPDDYNAVYKYGDIVSLDKGAFVHVFEEGTDLRQGTQAQAPKQLTVGGMGRGSSGSGEKFKGFDVMIEANFNGYSPALSTPELEKLIKSKQKPWEDCLQFMSHQEQAFLVSDGFPASAIQYAWKDHPEWIKDEIKSKAVNRVSEYMGPGGVPPVMPFANYGKPVGNTSALDRIALPEAPWSGKKPSKASNETFSEDNTAEADVKTAPVPKNTELEDKARAALLAAQQRAQR